MSERTREALAIWFANRTYPEGFAVIDEDYAAADALLAAFDVAERGSDQS